MAKINDSEDRDISQSQRDVNDDVRRVLNYGKYQPQVFTSGPPGWTGRLGEGVYYISGTTGRFYICTTDNASTWALGFEFNL